MCGRNQCIGLIMQLNGSDLFDSEVVPFEYGHMKANSKCYGHRFMSPSSYDVTNFVEYKTKLAENFVILDEQERRLYITKRLEEEASKLNLTIKEDKALLQEIVGLAEYPQILVGKIDKKRLRAEFE